MNTNPPLSPQPRIVTATEDDGDLDLDALLIDDSLSTSQDPALVSTASWSPRPHIPIKAIEEDIDAGGDNSEWVLPPPSQPGDFLTNSIHRVPSKSILKKVSSYGNFDMNESISSSKRGNSMKKKQSFLSFDVSVNSGVASASAQSKNGSDYGLDLDSSSNSQISTSFLRVPSNFQVSVAPVQPVDTVKDSTAPADAAAGTLDTSLGSSKLSTSGKMRRNVSFNAVSVREYDRTIGDNVSYLATLFLILQSPMVVHFLSSTYQFNYLLISRRVSLALHFLLIGLTPRHPRRVSTTSNLNGHHKESVTQPG